jgi:hypothetical protein
MGKRRYLLVKDPSAAEMSVLWFSRKLLADPPPGFTVDWSTASSCGAHWPRPLTHHVNCLKGARVIYESDGQRVIWLLDGNVSDDGRRLHGRWPD